MELVYGNEYEVTVEQLIPKVGIVVRLEDSTTELIHISNISKYFVHRLENYVDVGEIYHALCQQGKRVEKELTLTHLDLPNKTKGCEWCVSHVGHTVTESALDSMIAHANEAYKDKVRSISKRNKKKRK